jgi:hypothetical protein
MVELLESPDYRRSSAWRLSYINSASPKPCRESADAQGRVKPSDTKRDEPAQAFS